MASGYHVGQHSFLIIENKFSSVTRFNSKVGLQCQDENQKKTESSAETLGNNYEVSIPGIINYFSLPHPQLRAITWEKDVKMDTR